MCSIEVGILRLVRGVLVFFFFPEEFLFFFLKLFLRVYRSLNLLESARAFNIEGLFSHRVITSQQQVKIK